MGAAEKIDPKRYTFEEYLALEAKAEHKSEFHNGYIYAMSGGTLDHGIIGGNMTTALNNALSKKGENCRATNSEVKVYVESRNKGLYPDAMVICGKPEFWGSTKVIVTNPVLIVEVLSDSTASYDRGAKFQHYQQLTSFKEYVLVHQNQPKVEVFYREDTDLWRISYASGLDKTVYLHSIGCEIALADIFTFIEFADGVQTELDL